MMTVLRSVAFLLARDAQTLNAHLNGLSEHPEPAELERLRDSLNRLQGRLNSLQAEADVLSGASGA